MKLEKQSKENMELLRLTGMESSDHNIILQSWMKIKKRKERY